MALEIKDLQTRLEHYSLTGASHGSTYVRWGRKSCPTSSELVYDGYAGGAHFTHSGGGNNYLCLPKDPGWSLLNSPAQHYSYVYGAEYHTHDSDWDYLKEHDVPCAICRTNSTNVLMIPAKRTCPSGWIREYYGFLMSEKYYHASSKEFVCMDGSPETVTGSYAYRNGALFYFQKAACGSLPCDPYIDLQEINLRCLHKIIIISVLWHRF